MGMLKRKNNDEQKAAAKSLRVKKEPTEPATSTASSTRAATASSVAPSASGGGGTSTTTTRARGKTKPGPALVSCLKCGKTNEEVTFRLGPDGSPLRDGCDACHASITQDCALKWQDGVKIYLDRSHPEHEEVKKAADTAHATFLARESGDPAPVKPPGEVCTHSASGRIHYYDVGFIPEQDLTRHCKGLSMKALNVNLVERPKEDGSGTLSGVYVHLGSLSRLSFAELLGLRKTRLWTQESQGYKETIMGAADQLCQEQGVRTFKLARNAEVGNRNAALKCSGPADQGFVNLDNLIEKAEKMIAEREANEGARGDDSPDRKPELFTVDDDDDGPRLGQQAQQASRPTKTKVKRTAQKKRGKSVSPAPSRGKASSGGAHRDKAQAVATIKMEPELATKIKKEDPELFEVITVLQYYPDCFQNLTIEQSFQPKLGRSIHQAGRILETMEKSGARQAHILRTRIKYCQFAQTLTLLLDKNPKLPKDFDQKLREAMNGLVAKDVQFPFEIQVALLQREAREVMKTALDNFEAQKDEECEAGVATLTELLAPVALKGEKADTFNPMKPAVASLLANLLDAEASTLVPVDALLIVETDEDGNELEKSRAEILEKRFQELAERIIESFASSTFFKILQKGDKNNYNVLLDCILQFAAEMFKDPGVCGTLTTLAEKGQESHGVQSVVDSYGLIKSIINGLLALLTPLPETLGLSAKDVANLTDPSVKFTTPLFNSMKSSIEESLVENQFWQEAINETQRTAATSKVHAPEIQEQRKKLKKYVQASAESTDVDHRAGMQIVVPTLQGFSELHKKLKTGALDELQNAVLQAVRKLTRFITSATDVTCEEVPVDMVAPLIEGLESFAAVVGIPEAVELQQRLEAWYAKSEADILRARIQSSLEGASSKLAAATSGGAQELLIDWPLLAEEVPKLPSLPESLIAAFDSAMNAIACDLCCQVKRPDFQQDAAKQIDSVMKKVLPHSDHQLKGVVEALIVLAHDCAACRAAISKYTGLGRSVEHRLQRDPVNGYLMTAARTYMSLAQSIASFELARDKALECMLEDDSSHVLQVLQVDIASELSGIRKDASSLALAVDAIMKARASDVQGVLQKCEEASLGMTRGGASDWKQGIKDENDLAEVSAVASKTLEKVDGASLGQQLEACRQAMKKVEELQSTSRKMMKVLTAGKFPTLPAGGDGALSLPSWEGADESMANFDLSFKTYQLLYCEGLLYFGHSSRSKASTPGISSMLTLIAGEKINQEHVQPALFQRAQELQTAASSKAK